MKQDAHLAAAEDWKVLYQEAFRLYRGLCLWNLRELADPTPGAALSAARQLRYEGDMAARWLAERIERAIHAA
ncbi:MAG: hypothetical protein WDN01_18090 [Rhizomicrobium sp.]